MGNGIKLPEKYDYVPIDDDDKHAVIVSVWDDYNVIPICRVIGDAWELVKVLEDLRIQIEVLRAPKNQNEGV